MVDHAPRDENPGLPRTSDVFVEAFARGLAVIRAFGADSRQLTLSEVAERAQLTPAGARRLLYTLVQLGYARVAGRLFSLTPAILDIGYSYITSLSVRDVALPYLDRFSREFGESCSLSVLDRNDIVYVARAEIRSPSAHRLSVGERLPAHATCSGHVLLSSLPQAELESFLAQAPFEALTPYTLTEADALRRAIRTAGENGYSLSNQHFEFGVCALAVPVRNREGKLVASMSVPLNAAKHPVDTVVPTFLDALRNLASEVGSGLA